MPRRRPALEDLHFHNPSLARAGVEVLSLAELRRRGGEALYAGPQRIDFHLLLLVRSGRGRHMVDFVEHPLGAGALLLVRPGQVQQWRRAPALEGQLVLVAGEGLAPSVARPTHDLRLLALPAWPTLSRPGRAAFADATSAVRRLAADLARFDGSDLSTAIVRHDLLALLLRLARALHATPPLESTPRAPDVHALFVESLETTVTQRWRVLDHARRLGVSESTLSRACVAATGRTAKALIDERVALEARRWLVHSDDTAAAIGHRLGFSEPTNFLKFFKRTVGVTPLAFRRAHAGG